MSDWAGLLRRTPLGVLVLAALLAVGGAGLLVGGAYLALAGETAWYAWAAAFGIGPLMIHVARHLVRSARWAWLVLVVLLLLLTASSALRWVVEPGIALAALAELALELCALGYLLRRPVRVRFGAHTAASG